MVVKIAPYFTYEYDKEKKSLKKLVIDEGNTYHSMMALNKGFPGQMRLNVHELSENYISASGEQETTFQAYFSGSTINYKSPFIKQTLIDDTQFKGVIEFFLDFEYRYDNHKASFIDALIRYTTLLVFCYMVWAICCYVIKKKFEKALQSEIIRIDQEVQMARGLLP